MEYDSPERGKDLGLKVFLIFSCSDYQLIVIKKSVLAIFGVVNLVFYYKFYFNNTKVKVRNTSYRKM